MPTKNNVLFLSLEMSLYNMVSELGVDVAGMNCIRHDSMIVCINGTTIANTSLFSKTNGIMHSANCIITTCYSTEYTAKALVLSRSGLKKSEQTEHLPDFKRRKTFKN